MATLVSATTPASGTAAVYTLITLLCSAGYTIPAWSDGSTLTTPGAALSANPYGSASSGAGNLGNASAWLRVISPAGGEWMIFRTSATNWILRRGRGTFTGGSPNATTPGTDATSAEVWNGALFEASPGNWLCSADSTSPYGFSAFEVPIAGGNVRTFWCEEPLLSGSYPTTPVADADPVVWGAYYNATGRTAAGQFDVLDNGGTIPLRKRFRHGLSGAANEYIGYNRETNSTEAVAPAVNTGTSQYGNDLYNTKETPVRIRVARRGSGGVGITARHRWCTVGGRTNGQTLTDGTLYWIYCAGCWVPWDSSSPSI